MWSGQVKQRDVREHDTIVIEDLHVAGMIRNHRLARACSACGAVKRLHETS